MKRVLLGAVVICALVTTFLARPDAQTARPGATLSDADRSKLMSQKDISTFLNSVQVVIKDPIQNATKDQVSRFGQSNLQLQSYASSVFVSSNSGCSATAIGPRVLLTARHCTPGTTISFPTAKTHTTAECFKFRELDIELEKSDPDLALCFSSTVLPGTYETLSFDPGHVAVGQELVVSGYGFTGLNGTMEKVGKSFNLGIANVTTSVLVSPQPELATRGSQVQAGDSGGGVYAVPPGTTRRFLVAVSKEVSHAKTPMSFLTPLAGDRFQATISKWRLAIEREQKVPVGICGIEGFSKGCQ